MFEKFRSFTDPITLARAASDIADKRAAKKEVFEVYGKSLEAKVELGQLDPLMAESMLDIMQRAEYDIDDLVTPKAERGAEALARLVERGDIAPIVAEHVLDSNFSPFAVNAALNGISRHK